MKNNQFNQRLSLITTGSPPFMDGFSFLTRLVHAEVNVVSTTANIIILRILLRINSSVYNVDGEPSKMMQRQNWIAGNKNLIRG